MKDVQAGRKDYTRINRFALDSNSPASTMVPTGKVEEFCRYFGIIKGIFNYLHSSSPCVILSPGVCIKFVALLASMTCI